MTRIWLIFADSYLRLSAKSAFICVPFPELAINLEVLIGGGGLGKFTEVNRMHF
jgi:hypothetical protein